MLCFLSLFCLKLNFCGDGSLHYSHFTILFIYSLILQYNGEQAVSPALNRIYSQVGKQTYKQAIIKYRKSVP